MASVFGLVLGPYLGALAAFLGVLVAWALPPGSMGVNNLIFLPSPVINAFIVGLIYNRRWKAAFAVLAVLVAAFWFMPPAQPTAQNFIIGVAAMWDKVLALFLIIPTAILMERTLKSSGKSELGKQGTPERTNLAFLLSLLSAILVLLNAYMIAVNGDVIKFQYDIYKISFGFKDFVRPMASYGYLWLLIGVVMLVGAVMLRRNPERRLLWGGLVFSSTCVSAVIGGGFVIGLVLGVLGGFFGATRTKIQLPSVSNVEALVFFLLAFIGNEADNAWGNDVFALPIVYEGIYQMPLEAVRWAFLISPYAYFIIRLIQAVIATLIAVPLLRNLKASGLCPVASWVGEGKNLED